MHHDVILPPILLSFECNHLLHSKMPSFLWWHHLTKLTWYLDKQQSYVLHNEALRLPSWHLSNGLSTLLTGRLKILDFHEGKKTKQTEICTSVLARLIHFSRLLSPWACWSCKSQKQLDSIFTPVEQSLMEKACIGKLQDCSSPGLGSGSTGLNPHLWANQTLSIFHISIAATDNKCISGNSRMKQWNVWFQSGFWSVSNKDLQM